MIGRICFALFCLAVGFIGAGFNIQLARDFARMVRALL